MSRCILLADATRGCHSEEDAHFFIRAAAEAGVNGMLLPFAVAGPHYTQLKAVSYTHLDVYKRQV